MTTAPRKRHIFAIVAGNALEFYDFLTFSYFSIYIGRAFFPSHDPMLSLLAALATFGVGFATRPIGAVVIGSWGDRKGAKARDHLLLCAHGLYDCRARAHAVLRKHRHRRAGHRGGAAPRAGFRARRRGGANDSDAD
ncbi:MAG: hypothetical protein WDM89_20640 [Rhizomicrobium sp.]